MNKFIKILLTLPAIIEFVYYFTYILPQNFIWLTQIESELYLPQIIQVLLMISVIVSIKRLWNYKNISRDKKWPWTFGLIIFNFIAIPIYLWHMEKKFELENDGIQ